MNRWIRSVGSWAFLAGALLASCGGRFEAGAALGGETHFLVSCGEGCGEGLMCIEGVCTRSCEPGYSSCSELASSATCVSAADELGERLPFAGTCDVSCASDPDCAPLGIGYSCRSGACRAEPQDRQTALASVRTRGAPLVRAVDADTCRSGLLWTGGDHSSAEMMPGSDCMACHGDGTARPLLLGGTVYPSGFVRSLETRPLDDCFGLEGVEVIVTDADGRERSTRTNRAGNFFFEGRPSELPMPYKASIRWTTLQGDEKVTSMGEVPEYGGCARCHDPGLRYSDRENGLVPAFSGIFTPGLYP